MVLYKRKPVQILQNPVIEDNSQEIWQISQTGEIFTSYVAYADRLQWYKSKQFSCEITGHMNLNYFEALSSETTHSQDVEQAFPEPLKEPVLRRVQFSTVSRIDTLVDQLHESFKSDFYPGEHVTAILPGGDRVEAVIREKTMFPELRFANGEIQRKGFSRYTVKMVNRNEEEAQVDNEHLIRDKKTFTKAMLRSFVKNTVSREPWNGAPWLVKEEYAKKYKIPQTVPQHLQRGSSAAERKAAHARKKAGTIDSGLNCAPNGSSPPAAAPPRPTPPIEIRPKSHKSKAQQSMKMSKLVHGAAELGVESAGVSLSPWSASPIGTPDGASQKPGFKQVKQEASPAPALLVPKPIKYPIEDLDLPPSSGPSRPALHFLSSLSISRTESHDTLMTEQKQLSVTEGGQLSHNSIDEEKAQFYLSTWVYLNIYCEPLVLDSFTFDDYIQALQFVSTDVDCEILTEIHCALLKAIVNEQGVVQAQLPELEEESEDEDQVDKEGDRDGKCSDSGTSASTSAPRRAASETASPKSIGKEKQHCADELFQGTDSWVHRLKSRDFKNGGWQAVTVGILYQLSADSRFAKYTDSVLLKLVPVNEKPTLSTVKDHYATLDCNSRVMIIHLLSRLTHETRCVRDYMEECAEEMTKHRKEKIEHQRARKNYLEELKSLEDDRKILLPENTPKSPSPEPNQTSADEDGDVKMNGAEDDEDDNDDADPVRGLRRGGDRAIERKRKRVEEKARADAAAKAPKTSKQFQSVVRKIEVAQSKITKEEQAILSIDEDLRQADCSRFRMMGKDRFYNTYWWFERNGMPFGGLPTSSTAHAKYANAMIWVQGPDESERQGFLVEEAGRSRGYTDGDGDVTMNGNSPNGLSIVARQTCEESSTTLVSPTQYGFLETPEEFDRLLAWLDSRGNREKKLKQNLITYKRHIVDGMKHREKYLADSDAGPSDRDGGGRTTRGKTYFDPSVWRCLNWRNDTMLDECGHTHYDHPQPRKGLKKAKEPKGVPLNRHGKPISRQGDRYNF